MFDIFPRRRYQRLLFALRCLSISIFFGLFGLCTITLHAQTTGSLSGIVEDQTQALIPGAKVTLVNAASKARRTAVSDGQGRFQMQALQSATYDLFIAAPGFQTYRVTGIEIHPGDERTVPAIQLKLGDISAEVTVTATVAGVTLDSPEKSALITAEDIKRLSTVGRDATELIKILPGFSVAVGGSLVNGSGGPGPQTMGFGGSSTSLYSANGSTPQTGAVNVISDGASALDPGDMGASTANINMDMVQEIKVQTSNFGADSAKGPVVINAVGKSGGANFHGSAYMFARNSVLNSNDWLNNYDKVSRPDAKYYYPGANIGGPVLIPGTNFNHSKKMTFFTAFEYYGQTKFDYLQQMFVPTARMLAGDLTPASIAAALNTDEGTVRTQCNHYYASGTLVNSGGYCYSPGLEGTVYTQQHQQIVAGSVIANGICNLQTNAMACLPVDPRARILAKFWPQPNRIPQAGNGLPSDGYNYVKAYTSTHNGYQYRGRVDENFNDNTKLYVTYNFEKINDQSPLSNLPYAGNTTVPFPTPAYSNATSNSLSLNFTKVFSSSLTNELIGSGTLYHVPEQLGNRGSVQDASTGWFGGRPLTNGALQLPSVLDSYDQGVPDFGMGYFGANGSPLRKVSYSVSDNLSKQVRSHYLKVGFYDELTTNNQVQYNNSVQGSYTFQRYGTNGCALDDGTPYATATSNLQNITANFLQGCGVATQSSSQPVTDLDFKTIDFYGTDEWKITKKLTLTYGLRFDHLGPWLDKHGVGLAVWNAPLKYQQVAINPVDPTKYPGISWHQTNSSIPLSGAPSRALFYSPRAGLAYDLKGNGKTVIRGGWGAYRFHDSANDVNGALITSLGQYTYHSPPNISCTFDQLTGVNGVSPYGTSLTAVGCHGVSTVVGAQTGFDIFALDPKDDQQPVTYNYNFTIDRALFFGSTLEVGYVGNQSQHTNLSGNLRNQNYIPLGGLFQPDPLTGVVAPVNSTQQNQQDYKPYSEYNGVYVSNHIGYQNYNALQASWNKQSGAFTYRVNYTWSKALGIRGDYRSGVVGDPSTLANNYGILGFNRTNAVNFTYSYQVGNRYHGNRLVRDLVNQWEISGITSLQSGPDLAITNSTNYTGFNPGGGVTYTPTGTNTPVQIPISSVTLLGTPDINLQPVVTCDPRKNLHNGIYGVQYVNGNCFALPANGSNGSFKFPDIHGPAYFSSDLTVQRSFALHDKKALEFRLSGFNFLNHPLRQFYGGNLAGLGLNFSNPTNSTATTPAQAFSQAVQNSPNFGFTPYKGGYRVVEVSVRYNF